MKIIPQPILTHKYFRMSALDIATDIRNKVQGNPLGWPVRANTAEPGQVFLACVTHELTEVLRQLCVYYTAPRHLGGAPSIGAGTGKFRDFNVRWKAAMRVLFGQEDLIAPLQPVGSLRESCRDFFMDMTLSVLTECDSVQMRDQLLLNSAFLPMTLKSYYG